MIPMKTYVMQLIGNYPLAASFIAWLIAQTIKFIREMVSCGKVDFHKLIASGGMPSSHSSSMVGLTTAIALQEGLASPLFALSCVLSIIVMYDAAGVRRQTGEQSRVLNNLINDLLDDKPEYFQKNLKELVGHTPFQVFCGAVLGIVVAFLYYFLLMQFGTV